MQTPRDHNPRLKRFARELRTNMTDAEKRLWFQLRDRRFDAWKFRRQAPIAGYIVDFYCPKAKLVIELDGGQHGTEGGAAYDRRRTVALENSGLTVLRYWDNDMLARTEMVMQSIFEALDARRPSP